MKRLAILGTDSTHTEVYGNLIRQSSFSSEAIIHSIWGDDPAATAAKAKAIGVSRICATAEEALQNVDGVLVLSRFAEDRSRWGRRALEAGLPVFIDKSLSDDPDEAAALVQTARHYRIPLLSCSPYRLAVPVVEAKTLVRSGGFDAGMMTGPRECRDLGPDERFHRIDFYGVHSAECVTEIFGDTIQTIESETTPRGTFTLVTFENGMSCTIALLSDLPGEAYHLAIAGRGGSRHFDFAFDADALYRDSLRMIFDQLFAGEERVAPESSVASLRLIAAMRTLT